MRKSGAYLALTLALVILLGILFSSEIAKYLLEKYSEKYTGRRIKVSWVYVNPFTGYAYFNNLKINESQSDSLFLSVTGLNLHISMLRLFSKNYEITDLTLDDPFGTVIQHKRNFNFDDLIKRFDPENSDSTEAPIHFSILHIKINNGEFIYKDNEIPIDYTIRNVNCESSGIKWNTDTIAAKLLFRAGKARSEVKTSFTINYKTLAYHFALVLHKFDLEIIDQYLKGLVNYGAFHANVDADIKASGNFNNEEDVTAKGIVEVNDFHFGKNKSDDYASFDKLKVEIKELSPLNHDYSFDSIALIHPRFKYDRYDSLDNWETMFGKNGSNLAVASADQEKFNLVIEIARYAKVLVRYFFRSAYKINSVRISDGDLEFNDFSIGEKFSLSASPLFIQADSIDKNRPRIQLVAQSGLKPYGKGTIGLSINPNDSADFDMHCRLQNIPITLFNPYVVTYTSFPLNKGTLEFNGNWHVQEGIIQSTNHLLIIDPRLSRRIKNKGAKWLPVPLIMAFIRERGNVIDYEIPITGDLKNPKFHFNNMILDLLKNIVVKPVTIPYGIHVTNTENEIEQSQSITWDWNSIQLSSGQKEFIIRMSGYLKQHPKEILSISSVFYEEKEKEFILFFEAKKKYFLLSHPASRFTIRDSLEVGKMSVKDPAFVRYIDKNSRAEKLFTIQQKCSQFVNPSIVNSKLEQLVTNRKRIFASYFKDESTFSQLRILPIEYAVPYNGFSYYRIDYKGGIPEPLLSAYQTLSQLNEGLVRKKYLKDRIQNLIRK